MSCEKKKRNKGNKEKNNREIETLDDKKKDRITKSMTEGDRQRNSVCA